MHRWLLLIALLLPVGLPGAPPAPDDAVRATVTEVRERILANPKQLAADRGHARRLLEEAALPGIDLPLISRFLLGEHRTDVSPEQLRRWQNTLREHLLASYSYALHLHAEEAVRFVRGRSIDYRLVAERGDRATVRASVAGMPVAIDLKLHRRDGVWRAFDAEFAGISVLMTYRSGLASTLDRAGVDGLIAELEARRNPSSPDNRALATRPN